VSKRYILGIDQSTSATKALLFDENGDLNHRYDLSHRQIVDDKGWVEHDPMQIYRNTIAVVKGLVERAGVDKASILGVGVSNQRETALVWDRATGLPVYNAIVWQCGRGEKICERIAAAGGADRVKAVTGLHLSPYFSAAKIAWVLENVPNLQGKELCCGTIDSWLVYKLTGELRTDYSNASRTQLFDLGELCWSNEVCALFGIDPATLPEVSDTNGCFGETDFEGFFEKPIPIRGVMGDSHGALFGQGCLAPGMIKATYGTGSSVMMNTGESPAYSKSLVTSLAWGMDGKVNYVLEGNINYTGAVIQWLVEDLGLLSSPKEAGKVAAGARSIKGLYLVPAFSGLGAPYWDGNARAIICGMDRSCGKAELVRAAEESIAYQIADILLLMKAESGIGIDSLRVDGGPARDSFLMQFQADIADMEVVVPDVEELSGMGAAYAAGIALGLYDAAVFSRRAAARYRPDMSGESRESKYAGWKDAVAMALTREPETTYQTL